MSLPVSQEYNFSLPGVWGPVTSTLDFCEANYQFSYYIAEMANSVSNLFTIVLALYGAYSIRSQDLPIRYLFGFLSLAVVGIGSFAFHASLLHIAQLSDELPMIYTASCCLFILLDTSNPSQGFNIRHNGRSRFLLIGIIIFNILFTYSYLLYRNPIYHQIVFAIVMLSSTARSAWLQQSSEAVKRLRNEERKRIHNIYISGVGTFILGFVIWNCDNIFCDALTRLKAAVGWPVAFLLEGHTWWHFLTGAGSYLMWTATNYLTLCIKDDPKKYEVLYDLRYIPRVSRAGKAKI